MKFPAPAFGASKLLVVASGAVTAMHLPFWLNWLGTTYPDLSVQVVLTASAERFVTTQAVTSMTRRPAIADRWADTPQAEAPHVALTEWCDCVVVYPACLNFVSRLAVGLGETPAMLALQCTSAPIAISPALPPGAEANPIVAGNLKRLTERRNIVVAPTTPVRSLTTGRREAGGAVPLWTVIESLERLRRDLAGEPVDDQTGTG